MFDSLSNRIVVAMVAVGFLSAIIGGILYQFQVSGIVRQLDEQNRGDLLTRLQNSRVPRRLLEPIEQVLQSERGALNYRPLVDFALDRAVWVVILVALVASLAALTVGWILTRRIVRPLERLSHASHQVAAGDLSQRVPVEADDEVGQVAYSFNLMAAQLQDAEIKRRDLLSDVSHELKTPLASIQGHIEALKDNLPAAQANPQAIYQIVLEDVAELDRMIGSLRTWLQAQSNLENLEPAPLDLGSELAGLLERFQPLASQAGINLELEISPGTKTLIADRNALRHLLSNLLDNALRYTSEGGRVGLKAWPGEGERPGLGSTQQVTLAVSDTGIGIAPIHWPHLFERFYRVDKSRTRDSGGTGLGLALVRDLVQAQGGKVWLDSQPGKGTTFFVTLPAK